MGNCENCASKGKCTESEKRNCNLLKTKYGNIKKIIGVISGKGGVGKSTVSGIIATELVKAGYKVGVLDGDITGPSMPRFFGINGKRASMIPAGSGDEVKFIPVETIMGVKVISLNLLTEEEEQPVIWRGPVITGVLTQMFTDTQWGDLDYLIIDMPPGTGDVALTVMQSMPINGMIIVSTPQDMVTMIVKKVVIMCEKMNINVLGVVENMSYVTCKNCNEKIRIFSKKTGEEHAKVLGKKLLGELPINLDLVEMMEEGKSEEYLKSTDQYSELIKDL